MPAYKPFDGIGSVLLFFAIFLLTVGIMQAGESGMTSLPALMLVGAGLLESEPTGRKKVRI